MRATDPRRRSRRPTRGVLVAAVSGVVLVFGFGGVLAGVLALGGSGAGSDESDLPTLPPVEQQVPEVYDADGCLLVAPDQADCSVTAEAADAAAAGGAGDENRTLAGFAGPRWTTDVAAARVVVLEETVTTATSGPWRAQGLVRNETVGAVGAVTVTARLLDAAGAELATVSGEASVEGLRSGEPAPFVMEADGAVDTSTVTTVVWSATATAVDGGVAPDREMQVETYWTEPAGPREQLTVADHVDPPEGEAPHVVFGSVTGLDGVTADAPHVVAAWYDAEGRVVAVADATVVALGGDEPLAQVVPGAMGDFALVVDGPEAHAVASASLGLWAAGS